MLNTVVRRLRPLCERFGLGRLPGADNRVVGAGYALAATAFLIGVLPVVTSFLLAVLGVADGLSVAELRFVLAALPFVTLSAFWSGVAVWRDLPDRSPRYGAIGGVAATCLTYLVSTGSLFPVVVFIGHE